MVEQLNFCTWRSTLIPGSTFDSKEAAQHYDNLEARIIGARAERADEELLSSLSPEAIKNIGASMFRHMEANSEETTAFWTSEFNKFAAAHPQFVVTPENCSRLGSFLLGQGLRHPYSAQQLSDAFDVLSAQGLLDLYETR